MGTDDLPATRISDHERAVVTDQLQVAFAEGRIDTGELESRLKLVNSAKFQGDLDETVADLPRTVAVIPKSDIVVRSLATRYSPFLAAPIICTLIYAMTNLGGYFWPMWVWFGVAVPIIYDLLDPDGDRGEDKH